ncbi:hypothetical protein [Actinomadura sp. 9N407]|uniref:hypothetical protein n=1 Tax=Actinomadura sp. 9N407 TaxID=3375154 RepID=UPI0037B54D4D
MNGDRAGGGRLGDTAAPWVETVAALWPDAEVTSAGGAGGDAHELSFLPNAQAPRLLIPSTLPAVAATALRRYSHDLTVRQRVSRSLVATAARTGLPGRALRDRLQVHGGTGSVQDRLSDLLGRRVVVTIGLGTARANRKPILHAITPEGRPLAFVKVGDTGVTRELLAGEAAALSFLDGRPLHGITIPRVLWHGGWNGLTLLVLSPLPTSARGWRPRRGAPLKAMDELFGVSGTKRATLAGSDFWAGLRATPDELMGERSLRLAAVIDRIAAAYGDQMLDFGAWHGDWTPWNMAWHRGEFQLWDWERFEPAVPRGFDLLHYRLQEATRRPGPSPYERRPDGAADLTGPLGVTGAAAAATADLYYLALCCRYQRAAGGPLGDAVLGQADRLLELLEDTGGKP